MYVPPAFQVTDPAELFDFIEQHSFGVLVSLHDGVPFATHMPFLVDRNSGTHGELIGHVARANPHWTQANGQNALAIFSGPHAYVSPTWYESPNTVPTWNYTAVHATGRLSIIENSAELLSILKRTVDQYESPKIEPWRFDSESDYNQKLVQSVVGIRIRIEKIEGKYKLSQNQSLERQAKVVRALEKSPDSDDRAVAELMRKNLQSDANRDAP